jgi:hypothetical protein
VQGVQKQDVGDEKPKFFLRIAPFEGQAHFGQGANEKQIGEDQERELLPLPENPRSFH